MRPSLVVLDDPQTDESARSLSQCANRESILAGAVLGLAGPGKKICGIMPCTVIRPGDMADNILDRDKHPEWNGERTKMVYSFPTNEKLWQQYAELRADSLRAGKHGEEATEFYRANRTEMDKGAHVAWPERFNHDELSALQHAMNLKLQDEAAFFAEYQNEPLPAESFDTDDLTADQIAARVNRLERGAVPIRRSAPDDVRRRSGHTPVLRRGRLGKGFYRLRLRLWRVARPAASVLHASGCAAHLALATKNTGLEGSIYAGLEMLTNDYLARDWLREDGAAMRIGTVSDRRQLGQFDRRGLSVLPAVGARRHSDAQSRPVRRRLQHSLLRIQAQGWRSDGTQLANAKCPRASAPSGTWCSTPTTGSRSFMHAWPWRWGIGAACRCLASSPEQHRLFAEHLTAEYRVKTEGRGRIVDEWKQRPERGDNHWFDCLVGSAVAASIEGAVLPSIEAPPKMRKRITLAELRAAPLREEYRWVSISDIDSVN